MRYLMLLLVVATTTIAAPLETTLTYQGQLQQAGQPANGTFDLTFNLYDLDSGGSPVATEIVAPGVAVSNGIFTVDLDFGIGPFAGDQLWLEIAVTPDQTSATPVTLSPRQPLRATPYALHAQFVAEGSIGAGEIAGGAVGVTQIDTAQVQQRVSGSCQPGSAIRSISDSGFVSCESLDDDDWQRSGSFLSADGSVGIGGATSNVGSASLTVQDYDALNLDNFGGMYVDVGRSGGEVPFYGYAVDGFPRAFTEFNELSDLFRIWNGGYGLVMDRSQRTGLNVLEPEQTLHVGGTARLNSLAHGGSGGVTVLADGNGDLTLAPGGARQVMSVPYAAFEVDNTNNAALVYQSNRGAYIEQSNPAFGVLTAPLNLPHGAVVREVTFHYRDNSSSDLNAQLRVNTHTQGTFSSPLIATTAGASTSFRTLSFLDQNLVIDNASNFYTLAITVTGDSDNELTVRSVVIVYTL